MSEKIVKIDVSNWEFGSIDIGKGITAALSQQVAEVIFQELSTPASNMHPSIRLNGSAPAIQIWDDNGMLFEHVSSFAEIIDQCFYWDMRDPDDRKVCLQIADDLEAQAKRLREAVTSADEVD